MTLEDILSGESKNVEFKSELPPKSVKYMKSVVAFANCRGGKIVFGVEDKTCRVIGVDKDTVFQTIDAVTNAISDSCYPAIIADVTLNTIEGKTVIIVEIAPGKQRPYYIKSQGLENGVYIRVAGTSRPADEHQIRELMFEGSNRSYDKTVCLGLKSTGKDIDALCREMKEINLSNCSTEVQKAEVKDVTVNQLLSWGILIDNEGEVVPTNGYALLTGNPIIPAKIQCAVFKGNTRTVFVDRREYDGPIQSQIEEAYKFVLRNIHLGAKIVGIYRNDEYEIPAEAIRELIINAVVHRSYLEPANVQVAVFDDRLEITSPGSLTMGQTIEKMKQGYSHIRNQAIASAFSYMNLIEQWGSGIPKVIELIKEAGLREPEFIDMESALRINIYRCCAAPIEPKNDPIDLNSDPIYSENDPIDPNIYPIQTKNDLIQSKLPKEKLVLEALKSNPSFTKKELSLKIGVSESTVKRILSGLQNNGIIRREGSNRKGKWVVL